MSLHLPARRAIQAASAALRPSATTSLCSSMQSLALATTPAKPVTAAGQLIQRRNIWDWARRFGGRNKNKDELDREFAKSVKEKEEKESEDALNLQKKLTTANLNDSIFAEAGEFDGKEADREGKPTAPTADGQARLRSGGLRTYEAMSRSTDPDPRSRVRWQRKMVARMVARRLDPRDRETREERIARTERTYVSRGPLLRTSTKKLLHLSHQVAGKTLDDALVQMRFSKKKWAREITHQLDLARDEATVVAGMGQGQKEDFEPVKLQTKKGKWITIDDPSTLYIEQAWVNRGPHHLQRPDYRARGRSFPKVDKTSNITLVLKEEKTRLRQNEEKKAKEAKKAPWVHLPNRPITAQRQHYSW